RSTSFCSRISLLGKYRYSVALPSPASAAISSTELSAKPLRENRCKAASRIWSRRASAYSSCLAAATLRMLLILTYRSVIIKPYNRLVGYLFVRSHSDGCRCSQTGTHPQAGTAQGTAPSLFAQGGAGGRAPQVAGRDRGNAGGDAGNPRQLDSQRMLAAHAGQLLGQRGRSDLGHHQLHRRQRDHDSADRMDLLAFRAQALFPDLGRY